MTALQDMLQEILNSKPIYHPSRFWDDLSDKHIKQIESQGLENFKQTVNTRYFDWGILGILLHQTKPFFHLLNARKLDRIKDATFEGCKIRKFNKFSSYLYKAHVVSLYEYVKDIDRCGIFEWLEEPALGNPIIIKYDGKSISQDLCNSVHEFYSIKDGRGLDRNTSFMELGSGYGRTAFIFLSTMSGCSYTLVDIPPALYVAQEYLSQLFKDDEIFRFRHFDDFDDVKKEFRHSRIRFLTPNQLELLPEKEFDITLNINSLQEMSLPQIINFMWEFRRLTKRYFYMKEWKVSIVPDNYHIKRGEYPIPDSWKEVYSREHPIQSLFFEALYGVRG